MYVNKLVLQISIILSILFLVAPVVTAEEKFGQAIFKDLLIETEGTEIKANEPMIVFEGQTFLPLRVITDSFNKQLYLDESRNLIIKSNPSSVDNQLVDSNGKTSDFRPEIKFNQQIVSAGAVVLEDSKRNIMFEKNAHSTFYPASTTKILTALLAIEHGNLDDEVEISNNVTTLPGDSRRVFIKPGDVLTLRQLLYATLLHSGNDSALAIAEHIAGSEEAFAKLMNEKAMELGAKNSNFVNPHGYHHPEHYTTPYDLAVIMKAASDHPLFIEIINTPAYKAVYRDKNGNKLTRTWKTTNQFLKNPSLTTKGVIGGKTGYTDAAGRTLVTVSEHNGHRYITATLKSTSAGRYIDTKKLLLNAYKHREEYEKNVVKKIKVSNIDTILVVDGQQLPQTDNMFLYKGRTYISQSYINENIAQVHQEEVSAKIAKCQINPLFENYSLDMDELSLALFKQSEQQQIKARSSLLSLNYLQPLSLMLGTQVFHTAFLHDTIIMSEEK